MPVYNRLKDQHRFQRGGENWGIKARTTKLVPFQFWVDDSLDTGSIEFTLKPLRGLGDIDLIAYLTLHQNDDDSRTWFSLTDSGYNMGLECGFYYVEIVHKTSTWYTEVFHIVDDQYFDGLNGADDHKKFVYALEWWNNMDMGDTLYSEGWRNKLYLEMHEDFPTNPINRIIQQKPDGSEEVKAIQSSKQRAFQVRDIVPNWVDVFPLIAMHSNKQLKKTSDATWTESLDEFNFQILGDSGPFFKTGEILFSEQRHDLTGCQENYSVTEISLA